MTKEADQFSPKEARSRFEAALRGARIAGHKSMSQISPTKGKKKQQRQKGRAPRRGS